MPKKSSDSRKARRKTCWARGQARKESRIAGQRAREEQNRKRRSLRQPVPWELACRARREAREQDGLRARWEAAQRKRNDPLPAA